MICPCGGHIRTSELTGDRVVWSCKACGRYEVFGGKESDASTGQVRGLLGTPDGQWPPLQTTGRIRVPPPPASS